MFRSTIVALAMALTAPMATMAQDYPSKPITVIVPAGPGSATDTITRLVLNQIEADGAFDQPFVVVNASGTVAAATRVRDTNPDGYEILVSHAALIGSKAVGTLPFGPEAFEPIAQTGSTLFLVVAAENGPFDDFNDLVAQAKERPGELKEANAIGGTKHIAMALLAQEAGYTARFVQVGDGPSSMASVAGGHTDYSVASPQEYLGFAGSGIKALVVVGQDRNPLWPDVPTTSDLGYKIDFGVNTWWFAPPETPDAIVTTLADAIEAAMQKPELIEALGKQGVAPVFRRGEDLKQHIAEIDAAVMPLAPVLRGE